MGRLAVAERPRIAGRRDRLVAIVGGDPSDCFPDRVELAVLLCLQLISLLLYIKKLMLPLIIYINILKKVLILQYYFYFLLNLNDTRYFV